MSNSPKSWDIYQSLFLGEVLILLGNFFIADEQTFAESPPWPRRKPHLFHPRGQRAVTGEAKKARKELAHWTGWVGKICQNPWVFAFLHWKSWHILGGEAGFPATKIIGMRKMMNGTHSYSMHMWDPVLKSSSSGGHGPENYHSFWRIEAVAFRGSASTFYGT